MVTSLREGYKPDMIGALDLDVCDALSSRHGGP